MGKTINKVSFKAAGDKGVTISYDTFDETGPLGTTKKEENKAPHKTFVDALQGLKGHLVLKCEQVNTSKVKKFSDLKLTEHEEKNFRVCGVTVSHQGTEKEAIIITGYRTLDSGGGFSFNTPLIRVESESELAYPFIQELVEAVELVKTEADAYLHGKYAVVQGDLFDKEKGKTEE